MAIVRPFVLVEKLGGSQGQNQFFRTASEDIGGPELGTRRFFFQIVTVADLCRRESHKSWEACISQRASSGPVRMSAVPTMDGTTDFSY